jgi:predicted outer membrane repeat protein
LQKGVDAAYEAGGGEVWVASGVYDEERGNHSGSLVLKAGVDLYGGFLGGETVREQREPKANETIIDGSSALVTRKARHVVVCASDSMLDGFTITGGRADGSNDDYYGGGVFCSGGGVTLVDCRIVDNWAGYGGGAYFRSSAQVKLDNCVFEDNHAENYGGGVYVYDHCALSVSGCSFLENDANSQGGGMWNEYGSTADITNSTFESNYASYGGGLANYNNCSVTVFETSFKKNTAANRGSGFYANYYNNLDIRSCTIEENVCNGEGYGAFCLDYYNTGALVDVLFAKNTSAHTGGLFVWRSSNVKAEGSSFTANEGSLCGAVYVGSATFSAMNCSFENNKGVDGGAIRSDSSICSLTRSIVIGNSATGAGGAVYAESGTVNSVNCVFASNSANLGGAIRAYDVSGAVMNCTIYGNSAISEGGGLRVYANAPTLTNCILWANEPQAILGVMTADHSDVEDGYAGASNIDVNPKLLLGGYDLASGSPCLDSGTASSAPATDVRGVPRPQGSGVDMGAYERASGAVAPSALFSVNCDAGLAPLTVNFTDESFDGTSPITGWKWDFGDGGASATPFPRHVYEKAGEYTVKLTVTSAVSEDVEIKTNFIVVTNGEPVARFTTTPSEGPAPLSVQFTDASMAGSSTITSWQWDFGDGSTSATRSPSHAYPYKGVYTVTLIVTTSLGSDSETKTGCVIVRERDGTLLSSYSINIME